MTNAKLIDSFNLGLSVEDILEKYETRFSQPEWYQVGYNNDGKINAVDVELNADAGAATDLSMAVLERAMMHAENSYYIQNMNIIGNAWFTNLPSNTAFRGFGGPQGMAGMEQMIDIIARKLNMDACEVRKHNFYGDSHANITPYDQKISNNRIRIINDELMRSSNYEKRRKDIKKNGYDDHDENTG